MGLKIKYDEGQTPLDDDEKDGIKIRSITTRGELDEYEQKNIEQAMEWTMKRKFRREKIFAEKFIRDLHKKMFGDVWKWAGEFRRSEKNIGIDPTHIGVALKQLFGNCNYWIENKVYSEAEIAIRFKHELVKIHCFANGNGRHSRLMADVIMNHVFGKPVFRWNNSNVKTNEDIRKKYLQSLKAADNGNIIPLLDFAKS